MQKEIFIEGFLLLKNRVLCRLFRGTSSWHALKQVRKTVAKNWLIEEKMKTYVISKMKKICRLNFYAPIYTPEMNMNCGRTTDDELKKYENNFIEISSKLNKRINEKKIMRKIFIKNENEVRHLQTREK